MQIYALQGDKQKALSALRQAIDEGWRLSLVVLPQTRSDPGIAARRAEYQAMVAEIEADMAAQLARLLLEVASVIFPGLHLPDWTLTFLIVLVVAGFPLALILAWAFETDA